MVRWIVGWRGVGWGGVEWSGVEALEESRGGAGVLFCEGGRGGVCVVFVEYKVNWYTWYCCCVNG